MRRKPYFYKWWHIPWPCSLLNGCIKSSDKHDGAQSWTPFPKHGWAAGSGGGRVSFIFVLGNCPFKGSVATPDFQPLVFVFESPCVLHHQKWPSIEAGNEIQSSDVISPGKAIQETRRHCSFRSLGKKIIQTSGPYPAPVEASVKALTDSNKNWILA